MVSLDRELITTSKKEAQVSLETSLNARLHNVTVIYVHYATSMHVTTFSTDTCIHVTAVAQRLMCCATNCTGIVEIVKLNILCHHLLFEL